MFFFLSHSKGWLKISKRYVNKKYFMQVSAIWIHIWTLFISVGMTPAVFLQFFYCHFYHLLGLGWSVLPVALFHSEHPQLKAKTTHPPHCLVQKATASQHSSMRCLQPSNQGCRFPQVDDFLGSWGSCWGKVFAFFGGTSSRMTIFVAKKPPGVPLLNHQATNQSTIKLSQQLEEKHVSLSKF